MTDETRYCPTCNSTDLVIAFDDEQSTISCTRCGRKLEVERIGEPTWTDPDWVR